jgi:transposase
MTGEKNGNSKYSKADIDQVKSLLRQGMSGKDISQETGISRTHISRIKRGYTWKHETATAAELVHGRRKYSDEQLQKVADLLVAGNLKNSEIAKITKVSRYTVADMSGGRCHQRFMERARG